MRQWIDLLLASLPGLLAGAVVVLLTPLLPLGALLAAFLITFAMWPRGTSAAAMLLAYGTGLLAADALSPADANWPQIAIGSLCWIVGIFLLWRVVSLQS